MANQYQENLVSIIMPCHNGMPYLSEAIESALAQIYTSWELLIVDDHSSDNSGEIIKSYSEKDNRIKLLATNQECKGAHFARNLAINSAQGRYVAFLDCDDIWLPNKLEIQIDLLNTSEHALSFSSYQRITAKGKLLSTFLIKDGDVKNYPQLLEKNIVGCCTAVYDRKKVGLIEMPSIRGRQDYGLWLRIAKKATLVGITPVMAKYRVHNDSLSSNKIFAAVYQWKLFRQIENLSLIKTTWLFGRYIIFNVRKRIQERLSLVFRKKPAICHL